MQGVECEQIPPTPSSAKAKHSVWAEELQSVARDAFALLRLGQRIKIRLAAAEMAVKKAGQQLDAANKALNQVRSELQSKKAAERVARTAQKEAASAHAAAAQELADAQAMGKSLAHKRQRQEAAEPAAEASRLDSEKCDAQDESSGESDFEEDTTCEGHGVAAPVDHFRVKCGKQNPPNWHKFRHYSRATYQKLEVLEQDRRATPIDRNRRDVMLPPGDEMRGWFLHWRRGVGPLLQSWAQGSLGAIIHMLAECARRFDVVDELGTALGFQSRGQENRAATCIYVCQRLRDAISTLKWCRTKEQRIEYHTILGAASPRPHDGMIEGVAEVLGVTRGKR